jgi:hypothetical protein
LESVPFSDPVAEVPLVSEPETYGLAVCLPILLPVETGMLLLALEPALNDKLDGGGGLSSACAGLGRGWLKELILRS